MKTISARVRVAHSLVQSAEECNALSKDLFFAYDGKDDERIEMLRVLSSRRGGL
ncbi:hypothetical protein [Arthrobacter ramosus]|uniref:Uncharacterized protein n=1 Tax=Arthrobacter ramosus TaxID=1672 RepID=A0ABV5Y4M4_ARTRM|nr:hypothetical protein [Arthrobacter ramosus]